MKLRNLLATLACITAIAACGDKGGNDDAAANDTTAAMAPADTGPKIPRVMAIDVGLAADSLGRIVGGSLESFPEPDTLFVGVRTENTAAGTPVTIRLLQGTKTLESVTTPTGTPDEAGAARAMASLPAAAKVPAGSYRIEVLLDTVSQGVREIAIGAH